MPAPFVTPPRIRVVHLTAPPLARATPTGARPRTLARPRARTRHREAAATRRSLRCPGPERCARAVLVGRPRGRSQSSSCNVGPFFFFFFAFLPSQPFVPSAVVSFDLGRVGNGAGWLLGPPAPMPSRRTQFRASVRACSCPRWRQRRIMRIPARRAWVGPRWGDASLVNPRRSPTLLCPGGTNLLFFFSLFSPRADVTHAGVNAVIPAVNAAGDTQREQAPCAFAV